MEIVDENSEPLQSLSRPRGKYPWNEWLVHGKTVKLVEGVDFTCRASSLRQQAYNRALDMHGTLQSRMARQGTRYVIELRFNYHEDYLDAHPEVLPSVDLYKDSGLDEEDDLPSAPRPGRSTYGQDTIPERPGQWGPPE